MDPEWLALIIPIAYWAISLFFLCFPIYKRELYPNTTLNNLIDSGKILCIGHRGGGFEGPENTLQLFRETHLRTDMFELDLQFTRDRHLVVHHDSSLLRTCGVDKEISSLDLSELPHFKPKFESFGAGAMETTENKIATLEELFKQFPDKLMNIELKSASQESIQQFNVLIRKYKRQHLTIWGIAGKLNARMREVNPSVINFYSAFQVLQIFLLCLFGLLPFVCLRQGVLDIPLITSQMAEMVSKLNLGCCMRCIVSFAMLLGRCFNCLSRLFIPHLKKRGIVTFYWILNDEGDFERAISMGCSGIMTDRPTDLRRYISEEGLTYQDDSF